MTPLRKRPQQRRAAHTWDAIVEAAAQLFATLGLRGSTTNKIAERAGVSIGTLYQYFPNKQALLWAVAERHLERDGALLLEALARLRAEQAPLQQVVRVLVHTTVRVHERAPALHRLLFEQVAWTDELRQRLLGLEQALATVVADELVRLGCGGAHPAVRATLVVQAVEAQVHRAVLHAPAAARAMVVAEIEALLLQSVGNGEVGSR